MSNYEATTWGKNKGKTKGHPITVPSGQTCLVKRPGVEGLIELGLLDKVDSLTGLVDQKHIKRVKGEKTVDVDTLAKDKESLMMVLKTVNEIVVHVVLEPQVLPVPVAGEDGTIPERDNDAVYVDDVDLEDKMFIFQYAIGGSKDLEKFRQQSKQDVGSVDVSKTVARTPKRVVRNKSPRN